MQQQNKKVLILLSDGEDHGEELKAELRELVERHIPAYCVGIGGSREGALIPIGQHNGEKQYLTGANRQPIRTTFDESTLQEVAERSGGRYYRAQTGMEMNQAFSDIFVRAREIKGYREEKRNARKIPGVTGGGANSVSNKSGDLDGDGSKGSLRGRLPGGSGD